MVIDDVKPSQEPASELGELRDRVAELERLVADRERFSAPYRAPRSTNG